MHDVTIIGLNRVPNPKPNKGGNTILAYFDCQVGGLTLLGCAFVRYRHERLSIWPPKLDGGAAARRSVNITDAQLREKMLAEVQAAYRALGGSDGQGSATGNEEALEEGDDLNGLHRFLASGAE
jgi:hypothetical protein